MIDYLRIDCESVASIFPVINPGGTAQLTVGLGGILTDELIEEIVKNIGYKGILEYIPNHDIELYQKGGDNGQ